MTSLGSTRAAKSADAFERAARVAQLDDMIHRLAAHALHRRQRVIDDARLGVAGEDRFGAVDVGRQHLDAQPLRFLAEDVEPVGVADIERHRGGEEFDRIIRLEIGRLIGDLGIGRGMALVEAVAREFLRLLENLLGDGGQDAALAPRP